MKHSVVKCLDTIKSDKNLNRNLIFSTVYSNLKNLCLETIDQVAVSNYEIKFKNRYETKIRLAISKFQANTGVDFDLLWIDFKDLLTELRSRVQKSRQLKLSDVSPYLAGAVDLDVFIPCSNDSTTIKIFSREITALPTKTKPKKLSMFCSSGFKHSFLLKGMEDLHLDERVIQLISTCNELLSQDRKSQSKQLSAKTYQIIPFGNDFGLIQWVNNCTPLFTFYKRWQQIMKSIASDGNEDFRPSEIFFSKVAVALKGSKVSYTARRTWPKEILEQVHNELVDETPNTLISNELAHSSINPSAWLKKITNFTRSTAVMSIIGYIIGLGDRHLDNILLNLSNGDVTHIDFNICFDRGKRLRIPEIVPFRLTGNITRAFGAVGIDGTFRRSCECVLEVLCKNQYVLLELLNVFDYDPLVNNSNGVSASLLFQNLLGIF